MKKHRWGILIALLLIFISAFLYWLHLSIFHDKHHLMVFALEDLAFLPLEVLIVTFVLHRLLEFRDKKTQLSKVNMIVGTFFTKTGTEFLRYLITYDNNSNDIDTCFQVKADWENKDFVSASRCLATHKASLDIDEDFLAVVKKELINNREFILGLLQNPVLIEHKSFTDLLLAVSHLSDELSYRSSIDGLPESDLQHLALDIERVYVRLLKEWLIYIKYLKNNYSYLYSLMLRLNPFDKERDIVIK